MEMERSNDSRSKRAPNSDLSRHDLQYRGVVMETALTGDARYPERCNNRRSSNNIGDES